MAGGLETPQILSQHTPLVSQTHSLVQFGLGYSLVQFGTVWPEMQESPGGKERCNWGGGREVAFPTFYGVFLSPWEAT